jgi:hypothetical protein
MINRRSMPDSDAAFLQLKEENIVRETIDLLGQPIREVLTTK